MKCSSGFRMRAELLFLWGPLHRMSAYHTLCPAWPCAVFYCFALHFRALFLPLLHESNHELSFSVPGNSCNQFSGRQTTFVQCLFGFLVKVCALTTLTALCFQHWRMKPRFLHQLLEHCDWDIYCHIRGIALGVNADVIVCVLCSPLSIFAIHLAQKLL